MPNAKAQKISLGFHGGQVLTARVPTTDLDELKSKLGSEGWHSFTSDDGTVTVDLDEVVYLLVDDEQQRVGFGS
jgi:hypothetical protein